WAVLAAAYIGVRWAVLGGLGGSGNPAPVFHGQDGSTIRLTAIAVLADVARLLVFPLALSADYSPDERTAVPSLWDARLVLGGLRSAFRVGVWRDDRAATLALLHDAPRSYFSWQNLAWQYLRAGQFARAIGAFQTSSRIYRYDARVYIAAAHAAYALRQEAA